ncbi:MAG: hypothetical protein KDA44_22380 [Planctomycetales bacterium]|nr:hypothetical protein [Planctomycetales bacterium]
MCAARLLNCFLVCAGLLIAVDAAPAAGQGYMRQRPAAVAESSAFAPGYSHGGYGRWRGGYYPGGFGGAFAGSWYARPYPYHLDYYRYRWGAPPAQAPYGMYETSPVDAPVPDAIVEPGAIVVP